MKNSPSIEAKRMEALNNMSMIFRLTDERYFADISKAVETKNEALWMKTSEKAGLTKDVAVQLWKLSNDTKMIPGIVWFAPEGKASDESRKLK